MISDIGDQKTNKSTFIITKQCNKTGEEFNVRLTNNLNQVNSVTATILTSNPNNVTRSYVYSYCSNGSINKCIAQRTFNGISNYKTTKNDTIEFWLYCSEEAAQNNETMKITAYWVSDIDQDDFSKGL